MTDLKAADQLLSELLESSTVLLTGPENPDGDSIGACLALQRVLARHGVRAVVAGTPSYRYSSLPGADAMVADEAVTATWDAVVVLDGDRHRLPEPVSRAFSAARLRGLVDHHASSTPEGYDIAWIDSTSCSTCSMLAEAFDRWGERLDPQLAEVLYAGIVFDTGGFRYSNTSPETHQMVARLLATGFDHAAVSASILAERRAAGLRLAGEVFRDMTLHAEGRLAMGTVTLAQRERLGVAQGDLEGIVDALVHIVGVEVAALLIEREAGVVKYSLRSRGRVDLLPLAGALSPTGGGHAKAAGAKRICSVEDGLKAALAVLEPAALAL